MESVFIFSEFIMKIENYFNFNITPQQLSIFNAIKGFVKDSSKDVFILRGYAGTGKTTLLDGVVKWLDKNEILFALLASTGRAAKILKDKTRTNAITIHSEIYVFNDIDDNLEAISSKQNKIDVDDKGLINLVFELKSITSQRKKVYLIDESSMIGDSYNKSNSFAEG